MKKWLWIILILINVTANAAIYTQSDTNGTTTYSDVPLSSNAKEMEVSDGAQVISNPNPTPSNVNSPLTQPKKESYNYFNIVSPADKDAIQNQPDIVVQIKTEPELRKGDTIQVSLDGKPIGKPEHGMTFHLGLVERGEHTISATLYDAKQTVIKQTRSITIFVHRASVNQPANSQAAS